MRTLVMIPAYNEQEAILDTVRDLRLHHPEVDVLVINDASVDATRKILRENSINHLDLPLNLGIGGGVQTGYLYALENGYDIAVQIDGDGQHPASELNKIIQPIIEGKANVVVGSRFVEKDGFQSSALRRIGIKFLSRMIYITTKLKVADVTSGYRAVDRKYIEIFAKEYAQDYPEPEALVTIARTGGTVAEVPVIMKERQGGVSSISPLKSIYYMIKVSLAILIRNMAR
ncbi:MAG: glycosyltransferase family 2 protein [Lachnospiraceae bacterium]|nr:glycosyltransferase family 2 protein [Lachnospiraceae bacterium]